MTKQVQRRRGTDTQHTGFTGAEGEISVNTTNKSVHVHDGSTAGGFEAARADLNNVTTANTASKLSGGTVSSLTVTSADINGGSIDGTTIGGSTPAAGSFTNVSVTGTVDGRDVAADGTKLDGIEASADVTDTANVTAAGALMDSELTDIASVKALDQGVATTDSPSFAGITATTADINGGTIDGVTIGGASAGAITATTITGSGDMNIDSGTLFVDASTNNVGIGNTSPSRNLEIGDGTETAAALALHATNTGNSTIFFRDSDDTNVGYAQYDHSGDFLRFGVNDSERMRIDSSGNVGIGTSSPASKLTISGSTDIGGSTNNVGIFGSSATNAGIIGTTANQQLNIYGNGTGPIVFQTGGAYSNGLSVLGTERMRIDSLGHVTIGRSSRDNATTDNGHNLYSSGEHFLYTSPTNLNADVFRIHNYLGNISLSIDADGDVKNTNNSYTALSDQSIKENIVDASSQWDDIKALQIRNYNLIAYPDRTHIGVVAQEVESAGMNGLIKENEDGLKSVKYSILYLKAVKALQEAITRIETLEAQVATLQGN